MKVVFSVLFAACTMVAMAQDCCAEKKAVVAQEPTKCGTPVAQQGSHCSGSKLMASIDDCSGAGCQDSREKAFMAEAHRMMMAAEGQQACCKSTAAHPMAKGDEGCCNAPGETAKFKVFVANKGYKFFGCEGSAAKGREELLAHGHRVGKVQKVTSKVSIS